MFPSPVGDLYFSMIVDVMSIITPDSFRPLSGTYISQCFTEKEIAENAYVSVPCRGLIFLNTVTYRPASDRMSFRPLSGTYISQYHLHNLL